MAGLFSAWFGASGKARVRKLSHPRELQQGDIVKFRFLDQSDIGGQEFEVSEVNTYVYGEWCYPELVLKDRSNNVIFMMVEEEDGEEYLAITKKVAKGAIPTIIDQAELDAVLRGGTGSRVTIRNKPEGFEEWLADHYTETDDRIEGGYVRGDVRGMTGDVEAMQVRFVGHVLMDANDEFGLEIEIYGGGEIELSVTVFHDVAEIAEMWPGSADTVQD